MSDGKKDHLKKLILKPVLEEQFIRDYLMTKTSCGFLSKKLGLHKRQQFLGRLNDYRFLK
jgi:hypothetical protein